MRLPVLVAIIAVAIGVLLKIALPHLILLKAAPADDTMGKIPILSQDELIQFYSKKSALVIGGTRGVGYGTALAMARAGAKVTIVGRSESSGTRAVDRIRSYLPREQNSDDGVRFLQGDIGTVQSARALVEKLTTDSPYNVLVVSAATFPDWDAPLLNEDGIDKSFAIAVVGRYVVYHHMHKFLKDGARVLNVLASGTKPPDLFDRELASGAREAEGLVENMMTFANGNEIMQIGLERRVPSVKGTTRVSTHPGILKTDLHRGQGFLFDVFEGLLVFLIGIGEEEAGVKQASILASEKLHSGALSYVDEFRNGRLASDELLRLADANLDWLWSLLTKLEEK